MKGLEGIMTLQKAASWLSTDTLVMTNADTTRQTKIRSRQPPLYT